MANKHATLTSLFTSIADAIRGKTGGTGTIVADDFPDAISGISTGEDLTTELTEQDSLLVQLAEAVSGKAGNIPSVGKFLEGCKKYTQYATVEGVGTTFNVYGKIKLVNFGCCLIDSDGETVVNNDGGAQTPVSATFPSETSVTLKVSGTSSMAAWLTIYYE